MKIDQLQFSSFQWSFFPEELEGDFLLNPLDDCLSTTTVAKGTRLYLGVIFWSCEVCFTEKFLRLFCGVESVLNFNIVFRTLGGGFKYFLFSPLLFGNDPI